MRNSRLTSTSISRRERGAALIFALSILLVLTVLGVSALRSSSLEQIMAGNTQAMTRAFEAAESGMTLSMANTGNFAHMATTATNTYTFAPMGATAVVETRLKQTTATRRSSKPTGQRTADFAHFDQKATATTDTGAKVVLHQGVRKSIPKAN